MIKLFKKLLILFLPIILIIVFFEYNLYKMQNSYSFKKNIIESNLKTAKVLILGNSHSLLGIDPDFIRYKTINMAENGQSLYYDYKLLEKYLDSFESLQNVIINVSYLSLFQNTEDNPEYWRNFFYERYYNISMEENHYYFDIKRYSFLALFGQRNSLIYAAKKFKTNLAEGIRENGFSPKNSRFVTLSDSIGKKTVLTHQAMMDEKNLQKNIQYLKLMIKNLKEKGIEPVIVTLPNSEFYFKNIDKKNYYIMQESLQNIATESNIKYLNHIQNKNFNSNDFADADHLNQLGAEKFTKIIDADAFLRMLP